MRIFYPGMLLLIGIHTYSQEQEIKPEIEIKGSIRFQMFYDTYQSNESRDGLLYLYPKANDSKGNNESDKIGSSAYFSRIQIKQTGSQAFGADITALLEGDFCGTSQNYAAQLRIRHAFVKLNWDKTSLLFGQYWHTMIESDVVPFSHLVANVPFFPLNRSPQISATYKANDNLSVTGAALVHSYHRNTAPTDAQRNAGIPEFAGKLKYSNGPLVIGVNGGINTLKPRLVTDSSSSTTTKIISPYTGIFGSFKSKFIIAKWQFIYGKNITQFSTIGGYGAMENPDSVEDYNYSNLKTLATWADIYTNSEKVQIGLFAGYCTNLGADNTYFSIIGANRNDDLKNVLRISPRLVFLSKKMQFAIEYAYNRALYGAKWDTKHNILKTYKPVVNHRFLFSMQYDF